MTCPPQTAASLARRLQRRERGRRIRHPAEDRALRLDHREAHLVEFRKVGGAAVGEHDAAIAAVVRLAHRGVDADLGGDAADQQVLDAEIAQQRVEVGRVERALAGLVDHRLAGERIELRDDVVARPRRGSGCGPSGRARRCASTDGRARSWPSARRTGRGGGPRGCGSPACRWRARPRAPPCTARPRGRAATRRCRASRRSRPARGSRAACR